MSNDEYTEWNGRYLRRRANERPADRNIMRAMDAWMDLENPANKDVKTAFYMYRFFGASVPAAEMVERWLAFGKENIQELQYKDRVSLPVLRLESKLLFQHFTNKTKPQRCRSGVVTMDWTSNEAFIGTMKQAVGYLAAQKDRYEAKRRGRRGRQRIDEELSDDEVATAEDEDEDTDGIDDDAKRSLEPSSKGKRSVGPRSKGKRSAGLRSKGKSEDDEDEDDTTEDSSDEETEEDEESTQDEKESETEEVDTNRNRNRNTKKKGKQKGKQKGTGGGTTKPARGARGTVRSFRALVDEAEWEYNPDNVPAPPTKKRSSYTPMNEDADSVDSDTEVCIRVYVHFH